MCYLPAYYLISADKIYASGYINNLLTDEPVIYNVSAIKHLSFPLKRCLRYQKSIVRFDLRYTCGSEIWFNSGKHLKAKKRGRCQTSSFSRLFREIHDEGGVKIFRKKFHGACQNFLKIIFGKCHLYILQILDKTLLKLLNLIFIIVCSDHK